MKDSSLSIRPGGARTFTIAGVAFRLACDLDSGRSLRISPSFAPFLSNDAIDAIPIRIASVPRLSPAPGRLLFDSRLHWRCLSAGESTIYELFHPPTELRYCTARLDPDFSRGEIVFSDLAMRELAPPGSPMAAEYDITHPLDQLLFVPALAVRSCVLVHACGAVLRDRAFVFTGHSGDGKTTLARLLRSEGVSLLSDERVAIGESQRGLAAWGTPWPGEGRVVSNESRPLGGLYLLQKALRHEIGGSANRSLGPELLSRAIVPYYLPPIAGRILETLSRVLLEVPLRELHFERKPGLKALLESAA